MKRKNLHTGLMAQILILLLLIPSLIIVGRSDSKVTTVTSAYALDGLSGANSSTSLTDDADQPMLLPADGPGGPVLVISSATNPFSRYAVEILRTEGMNEFAATDISTVTAEVLFNYDVIVMGEMQVTENKAALLTNWVKQGGTLIAFRPKLSLASLFGISGTGQTITDKYLLINTDSGPGVGIVDQTIQFHGEADLYRLDGATSIATFYSTSTVATDYPAITTMNVGNKGGKAIAFTYDLAKSVVYTRQGNPAWAGQKRDGEIDPIRSDDMFYPDWIDFDKIAIPQADEQQRLLVNIILLENLHRKPLPRFWYLPRDLKAAIVMTGDNHGDSGTAIRFTHYYTLGPNTAADVADWNAVRATSYIYPEKPINYNKAMFFQEQGFEIALHTNTGCYNYTPISLQNDFRAQLDRFTKSYPDFPTPSTNRSHCLNWSDWASTPKVELRNKIRLDATYYYWPESWMQNRPGMFTGSGIPMRFADLDGSLIDVYQMPTQITDETNMNYTSFCNALLDKAIGDEGYYGVFCANMHTDENPSEGADAIIASAQARGVPVISAKQMLTWLDARDNSFFADIKWRNNKLSFSVSAHKLAYNLKTMLPLYSATGKLSSISRNGSPVPFTVQMIKGIEYAFFAPSPGTQAYVASYSNRKEKQEASSASSTQKMTSQKKLYVNVVSNAAMNHFNLVINSNDLKPATVRILDMSGKVVETRERVTAGGILRIGDGWKNGTYLAEVTQGEQKKIVKINKGK